MRKVLIIVLLLSGMVETQALVISEIMSNPVGDDSGREWVELYNDTSSAIDISAISVSIKGANAIVATPLSGGTSVPAGGYAVVASTVSGSTKFLQDYPTYNGILFKSAISLVNTGVTSIDVRINGVSVDSLPSYTAAKEGSTLSRIGGSFVTGSPTPGNDNQADTPSNPGGGSSNTTATSSDNQVTVPQMTAPLADIVIYMPFEKTVIAGAPTNLTVSATNHAGKAIDNLSAVWAFGDGGSGTGTSTTYTYAYTGRYIAQVEAGNGLLSGSGHMFVRVVPPDIAISNVGSGKYGSYVDIANPNNYEIDVSQWKLSINGALFPFPKHTIIAGNTTTRFSGLAMGFASTTIATSTSIKILFPNLEEVTAYIMPEVAKVKPQSVPTSTVVSATTSTQTSFVVRPTSLLPKVSTPSKNMNSSAEVKAGPVKDTHLVSWFKMLFK